MSNDTEFAMHLLIKYNDLEMITKMLMIFLWQWPFLTEISNEKPWYISESIFEP